MVSDTVSPDSFVSGLERKGYILFGSNYLVDDSTPEQKATALTQQHIEHIAI